MVNAEVIFAIDFEICYFGRLKVKSSTIVWLKKNSKKARRLTFQSSEVSFAFDWIISEV